uniref:Uncharacterized protein n=1 Tax=Cucumis melo TaxID=3656 RepID=A0A9I9DMB6_CUCME
MFKGDRATGPRAETFADVGSDVLDEYEGFSIDDGTIWRSLDVRPGTSHVLRGHHGHTGHRICE